MNATATISGQSNDNSTIMCTYVCNVWQQQQHVHAHQCLKRMSTSDDDNAGHGNGDDTKLSADTTTDEVGDAAGVGDRGVRLANCCG